jgi:hypothetical protein
VASTSERLKALTKRTTATTNEVDAASELIIPFHCIAYSTVCVYSRPSMLHPIVVDKVMDFKRLCPVIFHPNLTVVFL